MEKFIIDTIWPFINPKKPPENRSKIPFFKYENLKDDEKQEKQAIKNFKIFIKKIKEQGYNCISLDDLPHMIILDIYKKSTKAKLKKFQSLYNNIIKIAKKNDIQVFINFDIMYFNEEIKKYTNHKDKKNIEIIKKSLEKLFSQYEVQWSITRIGECDGVDVKWMFKSEITLKKIKQTRKYIKEILPIFENYNKERIFRTWTLGGWKIWDLMWNKNTYKKIFKNIQSKNIIISMKYWVADFFRNMELNNLFEIKWQNKIIELQTKREYEFFWQLPYYTGFEYEKYYQKLKENPEIKWIMVWCQTGWWNKNNQITFLSNSSPFVELNTISTINIFKWGNPDNEIQKFFKKTHMTDFLKRYNEISWKILYPKNRKNRYINKTYIPPILWFFWNNISINSFTSTFTQYFYDEIKISESEFKNLKKLWKQCKIENIDFIIDTLKILYFVRLSLHENLNKAQIKKKIGIYEKKYNLLNFQINEYRKSKRINAMFYLLFKKKQKNRILDKFIFNRIITTLILKKITNKKNNNMPSFVNKKWTNIKDFLS